MTKRADALVVGDRVFRDGAPATVREVRHSTELFPDPGGDTYYVVYVTLEEYWVSHPRGVFPDITTDEARLRTHTRTYEWPDALELELPEEPV